jgi:hypothetical protein
LLVITRATVDGAIILWQERNLGLRTTFCADNGMHLARSTLRTCIVPAFRATAGAAVRTTAWLIHQTFLLVKLLFAGSESKIVPTLTAFEGLVNETQTMDLLVI